MLLLTAVLLVRPVASSSRYRPVSLVSVPFWHATGTASPLYTRLGESISRPVSGLVVVRVVVVKFHERCPHCSYFPINRLPRRQAHLYNHLPAIHLKLKR